MTIPQQLHHLTATMPCKTIQVNDKPYLRRYYAGTTRDGLDLWLHEFLSADGERHLHNHPFEAASIVLSGGYIEDTPAGPSHHNADPFAEIILALIERGVIADTPMMSAGRYMPASTFWHRIASVEPDTWTAFLVRPGRLPWWYFEDADGVRVQMLASPREWWRDYGPRQEAINNDHG